MGVLISVERNVITDKCPHFKEKPSQLSNCNILGDSILARNLVAVIRSAEVGHMTGTCLHISSYSVPRIVVTSNRDGLRSVELPGKPGQVACILLSSSSGICEEALIDQS